MRSPEFTSLHRHQLDINLGPDARLRDVQPPKQGWIHSIRTAIGMNRAQLARRLHMSPQAVASMEKSEQDRAITLATLQKAADALNARLVIALVPMTSLEETVRRQAEARAGDERNRLVHTMRLEAQEQDVDKALDLPSAVQAWLSSKIGRLWD